MKKIIIVATMILLAVTVNARDLTKMTEAARNKYLVQTAREAVQKYAPDFYKYTAGEYKINFVPKNIGAGFGNSIYAVDFTSYDRNEEFFQNGCAVSVWIREDNGVAYSIYDGHGIGINISQESLTRGEEQPILKYRRKSQPPTMTPDGLYIIY